MVTKISFLSLALLCIVFVLCSSFAVTNAQDTDIESSDDIPVKATTKRGRKTTTASDYVVYYYYYDYGSTKKPLKPPSKTSTKAKPKTTTKKTTKKTTSVKPFTKKQLKRTTTAGDDYINYYYYEDETTTKKKPTITTKKPTTTKRLTTTKKPTTKTPQKRTTKGTDFDINYYYYEDSTTKKPMRGLTKKPTTKKPQRRTTKAGDQFNVVYYYYEDTTTKKPNRGTTRKLTTRRGITTTKKVTVRPKPRGINTTPDYETTGGDYDDSDFQFATEAVGNNPSTRRRGVTPSGRVLLGPSQKCSQYGLKAPHVMCLTDSSNFVHLEPLPRDLMVSVHNYWRANYVRPPPHNDMPKMAWDDDLADMASRWAAQCPAGHSQPQNRKLAQRNLNNVGENTCYTDNPYKTGLDCIDDWAYERFYWKHGVGKTDSGKSVSEYVQVIRQETVLVGCGKALCHDTPFKYVLVCMYDVGGDNVRRRNGDDAVQHPYDV